MTIEKTTHFKNCLGVFQGGGCKALAFVGAFQEARSRGVFFSEVAGTSAGSIFAALIAAGATPEYLNKLVLDTDFKEFSASVNKQVAKSYGSKLGYLRYITPNEDIRKILKFTRFLGLYSSEKIESWLNDKLCELLGRKSGKVQFKDLKLPLHVIATNIEDQKQFTWNIEETPDASVAYAVRCSCSIPFYFQPVDMTYVDGALLSNLPTFSLNNENIHFEKILCFTLTDETSKISNFKEYISNIAGAMIDGASHIQGLLQDNTYHIEIKDLPITTTDFDILDKDKITNIIDIGKNSASDFFTKETLHISNSKTKKVKLTRDYILNSVVLEDSELHDWIILSVNDTRLIYTLFPTLLEWRKNKIKVTMITKTLPSLNYSGSKLVHEKYRRFLLNAFDVTILERDQLSFNGFLFKSNHDENNKTIIMNTDDDTIKEIGHGIIYENPYDYFVNESLYQSLSISQDEVKIIDDKNKNSIEFEILPVEKNKITNILKNVKQYKNKKVNIQHKTIDINKVHMLTKYVKSYKYNQIVKFFDILSSYNIELFETCTIRLSNGTEFLITPPVVEKYDKDYRLIEGNSRLVHCYRDLGLNEIKAIVVSQVTAQLPSSGSYLINESIITTKNKVGDTRYDEFDYKLFRKIEENVRPPEAYIKG